MKIRHAKNKDAEKIKKIAEESWLEAYSGLISEESIRETINEWYKIEELKKQVKEPVFYVAIEDEELIGFIHSSVEGNTAHLHRLYILPKHQNKGAGTKLLQKAEAALKKKKVKNIELEVLSENKKGLNFYRKKDFEEKTEEEVELHGEKVKQKIMEKKLDCRS